MYSLRLQRWIQFLRLNVSAGSQNVYFTSKYGVMCPYQKISFRHRERKGMYLYDKILVSSYLLLKGKGILVSLRNKTINFSCNCLNMYTTMHFPSTATGNLGIFKDMTSKFSKRPFPSISIPKRGISMKDQEGQCQSHVSLIQCK